MGVGIFVGVFAITEKTKAEMEIEMEKNRIEAKTDVEVLRKETRSDMQSAILP